MEKNIEIMHLTELETLIERNCFAKILTESYEAGGLVTDTVEKFKTDIARNTELRRIEPILAAVTDLDVFARLLLMTEMTRRPEDAATVIKYIEKHLPDLLRILDRRWRGGSAER